MQYKYHESNIWFNMYKLQSWANLLTVVQKAIIDTLFVEGKSQDINERVG